KRGEGEEAVRRRDVERKVLEAIGVRAPDERADALEDRRDDDQAGDLDPDRGRLEGEGDPEKGPREERERRLLRGRARSIKRKRDRDERNEREDGREGARCRQRASVIRCGYP